MSQNSVLRLFLICSLLTDDGPGNMAGCARYSFTPLSLPSSKRLQVDCDNKKAVLSQGEPRDAAVY